MRRAFGWEWTVQLGGGFTPYEEKVRLQLEDAMDKDEDSCEIVVLGRQYVVDLKGSRMFQRLKCDNSKSREVRLVKPNCVLLAQRLTATQKQAENHAGAPRVCFKLKFVLWQQYTYCACAHITHAQEPRRQRPPRRVRST